MHILLVDCNHNELIVNHDILETYGHRVDSATSADIAATKITARHFDVAIIEINMPDNSGMGLLKTFATSYPKVPVFVLTEGISVPRAIKAIKMNAVDVLIKPLDSAKIRLLQAEVKSRFGWSEVKAGKKAFKDPEVGGQLLNSYGTKPRALAKRQQA